MRVLVTVWFEQGVSGGASGARAGGNDGGAAPAHGPLVVLLHGMGHTAAVWGPLVAALPAGASWLAVDLPGHGGSGHLDQYWFDGVAAEVASVLPDRPAHVVGHSYGGVVALALAAARPSVERVVGFGIKVEWTDDELAAMRTRASRPPKVFDTHDEALAAYLRFGGLSADTDQGLAERGVTRVPGGWRLAADPATMAVGAPDMAALMAGASATAAVTLACGEHDHMVSIEQLRAIDPNAVELPGSGHDVHVTHPELITALLAR